MFDKVIGHAAIKSALDRFVRTSSIPHALLFEGPSGIGKALLAREFALEIAQRDINRVKTIAVLPDKKSIAIDQVRAVKHEAAMTAFSEGRRVFIVEDADKMGEAAANSLLKILEEPPDNVHFVLTSSRSNALLPTILSRVMRLRFGNLSSVQFAKVLCECGVDREFAVRCVQHSGNDGALLAQLVQCGAQFADDCQRWLSEVLCGSSVAAHDCAEIIAKSCTEDKPRLWAVCSLLRSMLRERMQAGDNADRAVIWAAADIFFAQAEQALAGNANVRLTLERLFIKLQDTVKM